MDTSHVLVDGLGDRQGLYVAMSRGRDGNYAYCITRFPAPPTPARAPCPPPNSPGSAGLPVNARLGSSREPRWPARSETRPGAILPRSWPTCCAATAPFFPQPKPCAANSPTPTTSACWGPSGTTWPAGAQAVRFEPSLRDALPDGEADAALSDPACTWLWRSLREAEAAGLDAGQVLREAVAARLADRCPGSWPGHRRACPAHSRRQRFPQLPESWSQRVPDVADPELRRYLTELAAAMDDRVRRLGEHAAQTRPGWAIQALGDVPDDLAVRADWESRAAPARRLPGAVRLRQQDGRDRPRAR